ncbi:hypothetical protein [Nakamurella endophytica]|uniref:Uncharacterized protein n=1 Tax=Nakamurella endophytica TaxID=1748367 RepID=A0A917SSI4_9ACTN|nr:hypothetical protein [Nakamurella endophytica]GGL93427.1 hypothetical protein GCM10011594_11570 [Nakamurella endophytica]
MSVRPPADGDRNGDLQPGTPRWRPPSILLTVGAAGGAGALVAGVLERAWSLAVPGAVLVLLAVVIWLSAVYRTR